MTPGLLRRAVELDVQYADLDLGLVDASVMAIAEDGSVLPAGAMLNVAPERASEADASDADMPVPTTDVIPR